MQAYRASFAQAYNLRWVGFASQVAPHIYNFYVNTAHGEQREPILDLCCGTGQLARYFVTQDFPVVGLDLSPAMLHYARLNNTEALSCRIDPFCARRCCSI